MNKKLYRVENDRKIGGVCGGVSEYFNFDPSIVRIIFSLFFLLAGFGIFLYILMWIIVPRKSKVI